MLYSCVDSSHCTRKQSLKKRSSNHKQRQGACVLAVRIIRIMPFSSRPTFAECFS
jgi:hypothetical protein